MAVREEADREEPAIIQVIEARTEACRARASQGVKVLNVLAIGPGLGGSKGWARTAAL